MKDINYIIWGISNEGGYNESISSSFDNNILPNFIKKSNSTGDEIRRIALAYASDNSQQNYFYSLERVDDKVLYTIYRTNWYRDNRISYDAITLIINKNYILENAALSLKKVMLQYVSLKDSGVRDFNLSTIISSLKVNQKSSSQRRNITSNSTHAYLIKNDKKGFKKYSSESELNKIFIDQKSSLLNFNKVFFITKLNYLEEGAQKLVNLNDIRPFEIRLENFNYNYHTLYVDGVRSTDLMGNTFSAFEGDKVEVRKNPGNKLEKSIIVSQNQSAIVLEKIKIKKPKSVNARRGKPSWKTKENILLMSTGFIMSLAIIFMTFETEIESFYNSFQSNSSTNTNNNDQKDSLSYTQKKVLNQERVFLKDSCFYFGDAIITDHQKLEGHLRDNGITVKGTNYIYDNDKRIFFRFIVNKEENFELTINELLSLKNDIKDVKSAATTLKMLVNESIKNYNSQNNNDQTIQNKKILDKQEDFIPKKEVKKSAPKKKVKKSAPEKENKKKFKKENIKDCSAFEVLKKNKIYKITPIGTIKNKLSRFIDDITNADSSSKNNVNKSLIPALEFIQQLKNCECKICIKIKEIDKYEELRKKVEYYSNKNEKKQ